MKVDRIHAVHVEDSIDNRRVVRSRDERMSKDVKALVIGVCMVIACVVAYTMPRVLLRNAGSTTGKLQREQAKLLEENRELRLEKATLEDLKRVQTIANQSLGLHAPVSADVVIVERPQNLPKDSRTASKVVQSGTPQ